MGQIKKYSAPIINSIKMKTNMPLDIYDEMPKEMRRYLQYNGWHFNKKAYEFACEFMSKIDKQTGDVKQVNKYTKEEVEKILSQNGIVVDNKGNYDFVYAAQMCSSDFLHSSITDIAHLAMYVKDVCDDVDAPDGTTMRRWYATMVGAGVSIPWEEFNE